MKEFKHIQKRDRIVATLSQDNKFRFVFVKNTNMAQKAKEQHKLCQTGAFFLAKTMAGACLLSSLLKGEERIIVSIHPERYIKLLYAEALQVGEVRGFVKFQENMPDDPSFIPDSLGKGIFQIEKILYENFKPVYGSIEHVQGDITSEFNEYLACSEQIPSIMTLQVEMHKDGNVKDSWGTMLQALPGTSMAEIQELHQKIQPQKYIPDLLETDAWENILKKILPYSFSITNNTPSDFYCRCSIEKFKEKLLTLPLEDLYDMKQNQHNELVCHYCNQQYVLKEEDFDSLIQKRKEKN